MRARAPQPAEALAEVVDLAHDGRGIARSAAGAVFIAGALPGETVRYRPLRRSRGTVTGHLTAIEQASADRVAPPCRHYAACGGCTLQHLSADRQIAFKQKQLLDALERIGRVRPDTVAPPVTGPALGYRRRARLGAKHVPKKGGVIVGFREKEAPLIAPLEVCEVLDARVGRRLADLARCLDGLSIRARVPQVEVAAAGHVALVLRVLDAPDADDLGRLRAFARETGFEIYLQPRGPDTVTPLEAPARELSYSPDGSDLRIVFGPTDFIQVNDAVNRSMVRQALDWLGVREGERVLELFAGLGNFTLPLARAGARVTAVEGEAGLVRRARENAARNGCDVRVEQADLYGTGAGLAALRESHDAILLDPPRAGAREVLPAVSAQQPSRILYVSCHPGTLARDAGYLVNELGYTLARAGVLDMFPHTAHVESMALFERR